MKAPPSGPGIGARRHVPGSGINEGWRRESRLRLLVFIALSLLLHASLVGIELAQPRLAAPNRLVRESRLDLRLHPERRALAVPSAPTRSTETAQPKPVAPSAHPRRPVRQETPVKSTMTEATHPLRAEAATIEEAASTSQPIDYAAARETARQTARSPRQPKPTFAVPVTPVAEPETVLGQGIQRAVHPDCRTRYAGAGLLAIPLLLNDAVREGGCRW